MLSNIIKSSNVEVLQINSLVLSLFLAYILASSLGYIYRKYARSLSNHDSLASIFPLLSIITTLVIAVVKSSLALSLGLVGALSIVRFRTPIKEPEELTFIFFSIAIGLALGADQYFAAIIGSIIGFSAVILNDKFRRSKKHLRNNSLRLIIEGLECDRINELIDLLKENALLIDFTNLIIKKVENTKVVSMVLTIKIDSFDSINGITNQINKRFEGCNLSLIDTERL